MNESNEGWVKETDYAELKKQRDELLVEFKKLVSNKIKHVPYQYDTCDCKDCKSSRDAKELQKLREINAKRLFGKNWKNILSGMGDQ